LGSVAEVIDVDALLDLIEFAKIETTSRDVEPWADLLAALDYPDDDRLWIATLYNTYDDLNSAWSAYRRWPSIQDWRDADDQDDAATYPCTQERRGLRGGRVLRRFSTTADLVGDAPLAVWLSKALVGDDPGRDFTRLTVRMREVWGVGRQSAFEWAEFVGKVLGWPVECDDAQLWESEGPRRALQRLYGNPSPTREWLNARADDTARALANSGVPVKTVDLETLICDFNVMRDGRYYPGRHLAALREEINGLPDRPRIEKAWDAVVPEPWRGIAPGIRPELMTVYRDTGRIINHPQEDS
jgi:hypothetical protein